MGVRLRHPRAVLRPRDVRLRVYRSPRTAGVLSDPGSPSDHWDRPVCSEELWWMTKLASSLTIISGKQANDEKILHFYC